MSASISIKSIDKNGNFLIDSDEYQKELFPLLLQKMSKEIDQDGDGVIGNLSYQKDHGKKEVDELASYLGAGLPFDRDRMTNWSGIFGSKESYAIGYNAGDYDDKKHFQAKLWEILGGQGTCVRFGFPCQYEGYGRFENVKGMLKLSEKEADLLSSEKLKLFFTADKNKNGFVDADEMPGYLKLYAQKYDTNSALTSIVSKQTQEIFFDDTGRRFYNTKRDEHGQEIEIRNQDGSRRPAENMTFEETASMWYFDRNNQRTDHLSAYDIFTADLPQ